jgi:polyhydroxybutyrate depolymerase
MLSNKRIIFLIIFILLANFPISFARTTLRQRIKERINVLKKHDINDKEQNNGKYNFTIKHNDLVRYYVLYVPKTYNNKSKIPLIINLHGGFGNGKQQCKMSGFYKLADENDFIVACPDGTGMISPRKFNFWNDGYLDSPAKKKNIDDVGFILKMIKDIEAKFNIDKNKIYSTGISNGAIMSYKLACKYPDKIAAIAPVAGSMTNLFSECNSCEPVPIIIFHGIEDTHIPYYGGKGKEAVSDYNHPSIQKTLSFWLSKNNLSSKPTKTGYIGKAKFEQYGSDNNPGQIILWTLEDGGHNWPGSNPTSKGKLGNINQDISASEKIWEFFKNHSKIK